MMDQLALARRRTRNRANVHVAAPLRLGPRKQQREHPHSTRVAPEATMRWGCKYARQDGFVQSDALTVRS